MRTRDKPVQLSVDLALPGTLKREIIGYTLSEPTPDVDPDEFVVPFLRRAAGRLVPNWPRSIRRFDESIVWTRGDFGSEDCCLSEVRVGTRERHVLIRRRYSEPEQEMFPTTRVEWRWYVVRGLPDKLHLAMSLRRDWLTGRLQWSTVSFVAVAPASRHAQLERLFRSLFETSERRSRRRTTDE